MSILALIPAPSRKALGAAYLLLALAGAAWLAFPPPTVTAAATGPAIAVVWAAMVAGGGLASLLGQLSDRWLGELVGLPLIMTPLAVYALVAFIAAGGEPFRLAGAFLLSAFTALLHGRWVQVWAIRRLALQAAAPTPDQGQG